MQIELTPEQHRVAYAALRRRREVIADYITHNQAPAAYIRQLRQELATLDEVIQLFEHAA